MGELGRWLLLTGLGLVILGGFLTLAERVPWLGRLPGDLVWEWRNTSVHVPLGTMLLLSLALTLLINLVSRLLR